MIYLTVDELLLVAERVVDGGVTVRDAGLLASAAARPSAGAFGGDAYESLEQKAAALTISLVRNHTLIDGNKRLGLGGLIAFLGMNGRRLALDDDAAYRLIMDIADGSVGEVTDVASRIRTVEVSRWPMG